MDELVKLVAGKVGISVGAGRAGSEHRPRLPQGRDCPSPSPVSSTNIVAAGGAGGAGGLDLGAVEGALGGLFGKK